MYTDAAPRIALTSVYLTKGRNVKDPAAIAQKWATNLSRATDAIKAGVQGVQVAPTEMAARQADKMLTKLTDAVTSGRYAAACRKATLQDWQTSMLTKGVGRIATGAQAAIPKETAFLQQLLTYTDQVHQTVAAMPNVTKEDARARMNKAFDMMSQFRKQ